jgi:hypothetical protein
MDYFILSEASTGSGFTYQKGSNIYIQELYRIYFQELYKYIFRNYINIFSGIIVKYITDSFILSLFAQYNLLKKHTKITIFIYIYKKWAFRLYKFSLPVYIPLKKEVL